MHQRDGGHRNPGTSFAYDPGVRGLSDRWRRAGLSACLAYSTWQAGFSGPPLPTTSDENRPTLCSVNYMRDYQIEHGVDNAGPCQTVLFVMAGLLVVGCIANLMVRPVPQRYWLSSVLEHTDSNLEPQRSH